MSWQHAHPSPCDHTEGTVSLVIRPAVRDLDGMPLRRALPAEVARMIGPFIFFDHFGPAEVPPGGGMEVRPHPHINLATITWLFEGAIMHRDSLGSVQRIEPGAINLMVAGRGIVHSERTPAELQESGFRAHGLQIWFALPREHEETAPAFSHHPAETLPTVALPGARVRQLVGSAYGVTSPVPTFSPMFYAIAELEPGAHIPAPAGYDQRAAYVVSGAVSVGGDTYEAGCMLVLGDGDVHLRADGGATMALLGGDALGGARSLWWNFVSSRPERMAQAIEDWREHRFPLVPGDTEERIPLPDPGPEVQIISPA